MTTFTNGLAIEAYMALLNTTPTPTIEYTEGTTPANPPTGDQFVFIDSADHKLKRVNSSGTVTTIESAGSTGATITESAYASPPSTPADGDQWLVTDGGLLQHRASSAWTGFGPLSKLTLPLPLTGQATTLNNSGTMGAGDVSCVVTSASGFPAAPFLILIGTEVILVGTKSGTTFSSLTRGYNGTSGASHVDGSAVTLQNWVWANQGTSTVVQTYGPTVMQSQTNAGQTLRALYHPAPATPYTVTAYMTKETLEHINYLGCGIGFRENSSGKYLFFGPQESDGAYAFGVMRWNSTTGYTTSYKSTANSMGLRPDWWLQINDDGTNLNFRLSGSGLPGTFVQYYTNLRGNFFSSGPDGLAMLLYQENGTVQSTATFWSWVVT